MKLLHLRSGSARKHGYSTLLTTSLVHGLGCRGMAFGDTDRFYGHVRGDIRSQRKQRIRKDAVSIYQSEADFRGQCCHNQQAFQFRKRFTQTPTPTFAKRNVAEGWPHLLGFWREPVWIKSVGIGKPPCVPMHAPGADEHHGARREQDTR